MDDREPRVSDLITQRRIEASQAFDEEVRARREDLPTPQVRTAEQIALACGDPVLRPLWEAVASQEITQ